MAVFGDLNEAKVIGNITQDIEVRSTPSGTNVTNFSVATNRSYKQGDDWKDEVTFHNIVVWGNDADYLAKRAHKGTRVFVSGRIQNRKWEDQDGNTKSRTEIVSDRIILLDRYEKGETQDSNQPMQEKNVKKSTNKSQSVEDTIDPDDLPF